MRRNSAGFSILEAMMALAVLGAGGYMLMEVLKTGSFGQKTIQAQDDARVLADTMAVLLSDPDACLLTFGGRNPVTGDDVTVLKDKTGTVKFEQGKKYGNRTLEFVGLRIGGPDVDTKTKIKRWEPGELPGTGMSYVQVNWKQTGNQRVGVQELQRFFMVYVTVLDADNKISKCTAKVGAVAGIGTGVANFFALWKTNAELKDSGLFEDPVNQNLGLGTTTPAVKLDVAGALRPGDETASGACAAVSEGAMRYNKAAHQMEFCDQTGAWKPIGGSLAATGVRWGLIDMASVHLAKGSGVASVVHQGGTAYRVNFSTPMPDAQYTVVFTPGGPWGLSHGQWTAELSAARTADGFTFNTMNWGGMYPVSGVPATISFIAIP